MGAHDIDRRETFRHAVDPLASHDGDPGVHIFTNSKGRLHAETALESRWAHILHCRCGVTFTGTHELKANAEYRAVDLHEAHANKSKTTPIAERRQPREDLAAVA